MSMLQALTIALLVAISIVQIFVFNQVPKFRYKQWYRPVVYLLLAGFFLIFAEKITTFLSGLIPWNLVFLEIIFVSIFLILWIFVKLALNKAGIDDIMITVLKKINLSKSERQEGAVDYLLWPYYFVADGRINTKSGKDFFKFLFLSSAFLVILVYILIQYFDVKIDFENETGYTLIAMGFFLEYYLYLGFPKEEYMGGDGPGPVFEDSEYDFMRIWEKYVEVFPNSFNVGFVAENESDIKVHDSNQKLFDELLKKYSSVGCDILASNLDVNDAFIRFSPFLINSLTQGGNILFLVEIPDHFKNKPGDIGLPAKGTDNSEIKLLEIFTNYINFYIQNRLPSSKEILKLNFFDAEQTADAEHRRVLLTSVNHMLNDNLIKSDWIRNIDLLVVINFYDACLSTLSQDRAFSLVLDSINSHYKTLVVSPFRQEVHAGIEQTWMLDRVEERKFNIEHLPQQQYYLGFNFECWRENWNAMATPLVSRKIPSGIELAVIPISEGVPHVHVLETSYSGASEGREDLAVHAGQIDNNKFPITKDIILRKVFINSLPLVIYNNECFVESADHFSLIYDIENNAPKQLNKFAHLGKEKGFSVIVTKPHIFREYFSSNFLFFQNNPLDAIQPQLSKSKINLTIQLYHLLRNTPVNKNNIIDLLIQYGITEFTDIQSVIFELFTRYFNFNLKDNFALRYKVNHSFDDGDFILEEFFSLNDFNLSQLLPFSLHPVKIIDSAENVLFEIPADLLFQNYLPGQTVSFNGRPYRVENFNRRVHTLQVRKTESQNTLFYKTINQISVSNLIEKDRETLPLYYFNKGIQYKLQIDINEWELSVKPTSYFEFNLEYNSHFSGTNSPKQTKLSEDWINTCKREYSSSRILAISWEISDDFIQHKELLTTSLHILLYESLPVFFPYHHNYMIVVSDNDYNKDYRTKLPWIFHDINYGQLSKVASCEKTISIAIIEDTFSDIGTLKAFQRSFTYIFQYLYDFLLWLTEDRIESPANTIRWKEREYEKLKFLSYGLDEAFIKSDLLREFLLVHLPIETAAFEELHSRRTVIAASGVAECDYCNKVFDFKDLKLQEGGLYRCSACSVDAIDTTHEAQELLDYCKKIYMEHLGIDFSKWNFTYHFVTAKELHEINNIPFKPTRSYDRRKFIGQAWDRATDRIYVEKGYKRDKTIGIIFHELAHIWEYNNLDCNYLRNNEEHNIIIEGLAVWAEVNLLRVAGLTDLADHTETYYLNDQSEYGNGFRYVLKNFVDNPFQSLLNRFPL